MHLLACRVVSTAGKPGINLELRTHGSRLWWGQPPFQPEQEPGTLRGQSISVPQVARTLSQLDVVAPDGTPLDDIVAELEELLAAPQLRPPLARAMDFCWFRFAVHARLPTPWQDELRILFARGLRLLE